MRTALLATPDLDGIPAYDALAVPIGSIYGVLAEADSGLVRFFDIDLEGRQRHVLVPVGHARVERFLGRMRLRLRAATSEELDRIPAYEPHSSLHDDVFQDHLLTSFGRLFEGERYYAHPDYDHAGLYAGSYPLLREPLEPVSPAGLRRLSAAPDFRVAKDEPDIRGWDVIGDDRKSVGVITDLIIDAEAEMVRYVAVRRASDQRETALPVGYVELGDAFVSIPLSSEDIAALPEITGPTLQRAEEASLRAVLDSLLEGSRRYLRPEFRSAA